MLRNFWSGKTCSEANASEVTDREVIGRHSAVSPPHLNAMDQNPFSPLLVVEWLIASGTKERQSISLLSLPDSADIPP